MMVPMQLQGFKVPTGSVYRREGRRRPIWYARYWLADGREVRKKIGPAWTARGRPPAGFFTKRTAEAWLSDVLDQARRGTLPGAVRTGATFADAAAEYLRYIEVDRGRKLTTVHDYRSVIDTHLLRAFGDRRLEDITAPQIERWLGALQHGRNTERRLSNRSRNKILVVLHGVFQRAIRVWGLPLNPAAQVERHPQSTSGDIDVLTPEEVYALARAAESEQDASVFIVAAFTGLRIGELRALRWRDVDFAAHVVRVRASYANGITTTPKSGKVRSVPLVDAAAEWLARLDRQRSSREEQALVFCESNGTHLSDGRLRWRYGKALQRAGVRPLRFHDLRHTFGSLAISRADIVEVQAWMGHADVKTTMRYLHYRDRADAAARLNAAFTAPSSPSTQQAL
jgi:integrase